MCPQSRSLRVCAILPNRARILLHIFEYFCIAVENPIYEIHGVAYYTTINSGDCTPEIIDYVRKNLPNSIRSEMCPEGSSQYACNVYVEAAKCLKEEVMYSIFVIMVRPLFSD